MDNVEAKNIQAAYVKKLTDVIFEIGNINKDIETEKEELKINMLKIGVDPNINYMLGVSESEEKYLEGLEELLVNKVKVNMKLNKELKDLKISECLKDD